MFYLYIVVHENTSFHTIIRRAHFIDEPYPLAKSTFEQFCLDHHLDYSWWDGMAQYSKSYRGLDGMTKSFLRNGYRDGESLFGLDDKNFDETPRLRFLTEYIWDPHILDSWVNLHAEKDKSVNIEYSDLSSGKAMIRRFFSWPNIDAHRSSNFISNVFERYPPSCADVLSDNILQAMSSKHIRDLLIHLENAQDIKNLSFEYKLWSMDQKYQWKNPIKASYIDTSSSTLLFMPTIRKNLDTIMLLEDACYHRPLGAFRLDEFQSFAAKTPTLHTDISTWPMPQDEESYTHALLLCALHHVEAQWDHPLVPPIFQAFAKGIYYHMGVKDNLSVKPIEIPEPFAWYFESASQDGSWWDKETPVYDMFKDVRQWLLQCVKEHFTLAQRGGVIELDLDT